jgi:hypothetical protein
MGSAALCTAACGMSAVRLIRKGKPNDLSRRRGSIGPAVRYAFTGAMSPIKKESAYLHLPTYTAGLMFHAGTFLSLILFPFLLFGLKPDPILGKIMAVILVATGISGLGILIKRIWLPKMRQLSNPDDYISNLLVSVVHLVTASMLLNGSFDAIYFLIASVLFLYLPVGKLRHTVYFFAARYHLGFFYGWRGTWPPKN